MQQALSYLGTPYRRGGTTRNGIDCSGLIEAVYHQWGMEMPRTAAEQFREGKAIPQGELQPGDLVFFRNTYKRGISHVGIYVGDGRFIHAAGKRKGVVVGELAKAYYQRRYIGARRLGDATPPANANEAPRLVAAAPVVVAR
ncbi:MAG TPA: C40 family peptidase [Thermoanaerobaculia bacterium]